MADSQNVERIIRHIGTEAEPVLEALRSRGSWHTHVSNAVGLIANMRPEGATELYNLPWHIFENRQTLNRGVLVLRAMEKLEPQNAHISQLRESIDSVREYIHSSDQLHVAAMRSKDLEPVHASAFQECHAAGLPSDTVRGIINHFTHPSPHSFSIC